MGNGLKSNWKVNLVGDNTPKENPRFGYKGGGGTKPATKIKNTTIIWGKPWVWTNFAMEKNSVFTTKDP